MIVNAFECLKRDRAQCNYNLRIHKFDCTTEKSGTINDLLHGWSSVRAGFRARIAECGTCDEDLFTFELNLTQEPIEIRA